MNIDGNFPTYEQQQQILTIAQELGVDVDTLIALLGTPTSAASNSTGGNAHAKLNWLLSTVGTVNTNTATANLGAPTTAASNSTSAVAHAKLNWLMTDAAKGVVKSVQRGVFTHNGGTDTVISLSTINPSKAFVIVNSNTANTSLSIVAITATSVTFTAIQNATACSWQVIEFY